MCIQGTCVATQTIPSVPLAAHQPSGKKIRPNIIWWGTHLYQLSVKYSNLSIIRHIAAETMTDNIETNNATHPLRPFFLFLFIYPLPMSPVGLMEVLDGRLYTAQYSTHRLAVCCVANFPVFFPLTHTNDQYQSKVLGTPDWGSLIALSLLPPLRGITVYYTWLIARFLISLHYLLKKVIWMTRTRIIEINILIPTAMYTSVILTSSPAGRNARRGEGEWCHTHLSREHSGLLPWHSLHQGCPTTGNWDAFCMWIFILSWLLQSLFAFTFLRMFSIT